MTTIPTTEHASDSDPALWQLVCQGSASAFEVLVRRHQSLVTAVAYSVCGNLAMSEDVAQETFWTAWRQRASLEQPGHLGSWLCGIARNLGKNARRKASRGAESAGVLDVTAELTARRAGPRGGRGVPRGRVAGLEGAGANPRVVPGAADPLLSRGPIGRRGRRGARAQRGRRQAAALARRGMLREQVAELVEGGLRRSRPGRKFTVAVMAGLAAQSAGVKTAMAGAGGAGAWKAAAGAGAASGLLGSVLGSLFGLSGGWFGTWMTAQAAPTLRERDAILRSGRRMLLISIAFAVGIFALASTLGGRPGYLIAWGAGFVTFAACIALECTRLVRELGRHPRRREPGRCPERHGPARLDRDGQPVSATGSSAARRPSSASR